MNNAVFRKAMQNVRKHTGIKLITTKARWSYLVSGPNYHTTKIFSKDQLAIEMRRTWIVMNKPVYLGLSIVQISKIVMYELWYDYMKSKYE